MDGWGAISWVVPASFSSVCTCCKALASTCGWSLISLQVGIHPWSIYTGSNCFLSTSKHHSCLSASGCNPIQFSQSPLERVWWVHVNQSWQNSHTVPILSTLFKSVEDGDGSQNYNVGFQSSRCLSSQPQSNQNPWWSSRRHQHSNSSCS